MGGVRWKYDEDVALKRHFATASKKYLMILLSDRSWNAILSRGEKLGINRCRHVNGRKEIDPIKRFSEKIDKNSGVFGEDGQYISECWIWTDNTKHHNGYGKLRVGDKKVFAHRFSYEHFVSKIPDGMEIDHLCRMPACVNPSHLEVVTKQENILRGKGPSAIHAHKTHCIRDHEFNDDNTYIAKNGSRVCKACRRLGYYRRKAMNVETPKGSV